MHAIQQQYWAVRDYLAPVLRESKFKEHGRITPEEFVAAGDFLSYKFPVWSWEKAETTKTTVDYLPVDKQYLVSRGVPCLRRAQSLAYTDADEDAEKLLDLSEEGDKADEWVQTHAGRTGRGNSADAIADIPDIDGPSESPKMPTKQLGALSLDADTSITNIPDMDEIPDMEEDLGEAEDAATAAPATTAVTVAARDNLLQVRTYDVMITYDKYYQTPKIWLLGYDENRNPLTGPQILQDVSAEHAHKTVTIEPFPHSTSLRVASVHPCKHADVMKKVIERMNNTVVVKSPSSPSGSGKRRWLARKFTGEDKEKDKKSASTSADTEEAEEGGMRVDFYLMVFLKFIASIVPTIEVDSTTAF